MPVADIHAVLTPKTHGTFHLHHLLPKNMDFFVIFSSICAVTGSRGQCNYAAASTFQAAFARYRVQQGQKCVCINLGAVLSVGYAAEHNLLAALRKDGFEGISRDEFLSLLDYVCDPACPISTDPDLTELMTGLASAQTLPPDHFQSVYWTSKAMFRPLIQLSKAKESDSNSTGANTATDVNYSALLAAAAPDKANAEEVALSALVNRIAKLMAVPDVDIDVYKAINALGVDSLVTLEVKYWIQKELKANLSIFEINNTGSLIDLAAVIVDKSNLTRTDSNEVVAGKMAVES